MRFDACTEIRRMDVVGMADVSCIHKTYTIYERWKYAALRAMTDLSGK